MSMTQKDAFEFLELPESASKSQIKIRLVEKLEYFEQLSEKASSDFLRKIHAKNMAKVKTIQLEFFPWSSFESESEVVLPLDKEDIIIEEEIHTTPIIVASGTKLNVGPAKRNGPIAYLISHNENQPANTYPLQPGKNYIGRKQQPDMTPFIVIANDPYISRVHAVVYINPDKTMECSVMDSAASNGQPSKNGTYINGNKTRVDKKHPLLQNETVQIGNTKLVLKYNDKDLNELIAEVQQSDFVPTVVVS